MPTVTSHAPGTFSWAELMTSDSAAAKKFYTQLFGWTFDDSPMGDGTFYTMLKLKDNHVGALYQRNKEQQSIPPHWSCYVTVANVDDAAKKAVSLGGTIIMPPFDVMDVGRMAVLLDPTGAVLCLWQAKKHIGAEVINEPGAMCWNEILTTDEKAAGKFYTALFGWTSKLLPVTPPYTIFSTGGKDIAGMFTMTEDMKGVPPHWLPYFQVSDCDAIAKNAVTAGAKTIIPPTDIPGTGRFAYIRDPQGAVFAIVKLIPRA